MTSERLYKKADKADDIGDLDLKELDQKELVKVLYDSLLKDTEELRHGEISKIVDKEGKYGDGHEAVDMVKVYTNISEDMRRIAAHLVRPFHERFKGVFSTKHFPWHGFHEERYYAGPLLSALLNNTDAEMLLITETPYGVYDIECPKDEKIVNVAHGEKIRYLCNWSKCDGIVISYGDVEKMGVEAKGGVYLAFGYVREFGDDKPISYDPEQAICVHGNERPWDKELSMLMNEMKKAGTACDIPKIREFAPKINEHMRFRYTRR